MGFDQTTMRESGGIVWLYCLEAATQKKSAISSGCSRFHHRRENFRECSRSNGRAKAVLLLWLTPFSRPSGSQSSVHAADSDFTFTCGFISEKEHFGPMSACSKIGENLEATNHPNSLDNFSHSKGRAFSSWFPNEGVVWNACYFHLAEKKGFRPDHQTSEEPR